MGAWGRGGRGFQRNRTPVQRVVPSSSYCKLAQTPLSSLADAPIAPVRAGRGACPVGQSLSHRTTSPRSPDPLTLTTKAGPWEECLCPVYLAPSWLTGRGHGLFPGPASSSPSSLVSVLNADPPGFGVCTPGYGGSPPCPATGSRSSTQYSVYPRAPVKCSQAGGANLSAVGPVGGLK